MATNSMIAMAILTLIAIFVLRIAWNFAAGIIKMLFSPFGAILGAFALFIVVGSSVFA